MFLQDYITSQSDDNASRGTRESHRSQSVAIGMDGNVSVFSDENGSISTSSQMHREFSPYTAIDQGEETVLVEGFSVYKSRKKKRNFIIGATLIVAIAFFAALGALVAKKNKATMKTDLLSIVL